MEFELVPWSVRHGGASGARLLLGIWHGRGGHVVGDPAEHPDRRGWANALDTDPGAVPHSSLPQGLGGH